jgi:anti-sigma factor RsiW
MNEDIANDLTAYIDGELSEARAKEVEAALAADPALKALEQQLRATVVTLKALPEPAPSAALRRAVLSKVDEPTWRERLSTWLSPPRLVPMGLAVAAVVTAVVVWPRPVDAPPDEEMLLLAQNLEVAEDLDLVGLDSADDVSVVAQLDELEVVR